MDIGVGDADGQILHMDHDHMGIRGSYVVLNHQSAPGARGSGGQAGMDEFQLRGAIDAGHEGRDQRAIRRRQIVGRCPVQRFLGQHRLHGIELLVQIHHQAMQAVRAVVPGVHHCGDRVGIDQVVGRRWQRAKQDIDPRGEPVRLRGGYGRSHRAYVVGDARDDPGGTGQPTEYSMQTCSGHNGVEVRIVDAAGNAFSLQGGGRLVWMRGMRECHLQQGEGELYPIIRCQRLVQRRRGLQAGLPDRGQDLRHHRRSSRISEWDVARFAVEAH